MKSKTFKEMLGSMITLKQLEIPKSYFDDMFNLLKNDFNDEEFEIACRAIIKKETLYNKPPDPCLFYKYRNRPTEEDVMIDKKNEFISKVVKYLSSDFISDHDRDSFGHNLTTLEHKCLQSMGGIKELYRATHGDYRKYISTVNRELGRFFEDNYRSDVTLIDFKDREGGGLKKFNSDPLNLICGRKE